MRLVAPTLYAISSITVLAGAAIAPAIGEIERQFPEVNPLFIKMIITLPSIMVIPCTALSHRICEMFGKKRVLLAGLAMYFVGGCGAGLADSIWLVLALRAVLGIGMGIITPVCHSLPADFYTGNEKVSVIGRMSAFVTIGAAVCSVGAGWLAVISWRASFAIYAISLIVLLMVVFCLPATARAVRKAGEAAPRRPAELPLRVYVLGFTMFLYMAAFYTFPLGMAIHLDKIGLGDSRTAGYLLALISVIAFSLGLCFTRVMSALGAMLLPTLLVCMGAGYVGVAFAQSSFQVWLACVLVGIGLGGLTPLHFVRVNQAVAKENTVRAVAVLVAGTFAGQFASPFLLLAIENLPSFHNWLGAFGTIGVGMSVLAVCLAPYVFVKAPAKAPASVSSRRDSR